MSQSLQIDGSYKLQVFFNGQLQYFFVNTQPKTFENVKVWRTYTAGVPADAEIRNVQIKTSDVTEPASAANDMYYYNNNLNMYDVTADWNTAAAACRDMSRQLIVPGKSAK